MPLLPGARLGPYEIIAPLGAGGMGEVYRARDPRLGREVAVKVLPSAVSPSEEVRQRFEREARTISKLSHPNICALFDVGREGEVEYLVMELIEGETLAARLVRGRLPLEQVLHDGAEIAAALAAAHARGIVHRDLKPANIMLTKSGIKLLDFGLAKAFSSPIDGSLATTAGLPADLTQDGMVLGTVPYMSPEQVEGKLVDAKSDLFAFGAVLFEMASGVRAFGGTSHAAVMTAILTHDPPALSALAPGTPPQFERLVRRCLAKNPDTRWNSSADLQLQLLGLADSQGAAMMPSSEGSSRSGAIAKWLPWVIAAALGAVVLVLGNRPPAATGASPARFQIHPAPGTSFSYEGESPYLAVSPDGSRIAYIGSSQKGRDVIWLRALSSLEARPIEGTEGAEALFWSPDGAAIGFAASGKLQQVAISGGAPSPICDLSGMAGVTASWGSKGNILFTAIIGQRLLRVAAAGGTPSVVLSADSTKDQVRVNQPCYLPDGERFLYLSRSGTGKGTLHFCAPGQPPRELMQVVSHVSFTEPDLLIYIEEGTLFARRFDWRAGRLSTGTQAIADTVRYFQSTGAAGYANSANGTLIYQSDENVIQPTWLDRTGRELGKLGSPGNYLDVSLAPNGGRLLYSRTLPRIGTYDVWSYDLALGTESRLTHDQNSDFAGLWLPDGRSIAYSAVAGGMPRLHRLDLATGRSTILLGPTGFQIACDMSPDGGTLLYSERTTTAPSTLWAVRLDHPEPPHRFLPPGFVTHGARFSPDGSHIAFLSNESGTFEAYVAPYPGPGERTRISLTGATQIRWARKSDEIIYLSPAGEMLSVPLRTTPTLRVGSPRVLFTLAAEHPCYGFDVTPDGQRILALLLQVDANTLPLTVVTNWPQLLRK